MDLQSGQGERELLAKAHADDERIAALLADIDAIADRMVVPGIPAGTPK
ncbi:MAG: hypothetical protein ACYC0X_20725 [Pirellulaceae bacterium]